MSSLDRIKKKRQQLLVENNKSYSSTDKSIERIKLLRNELRTTGKIDYGDIAPIKLNNTATKEEEKKDTWFNSGAFGDGYDFGDITKTLLGTVGDVGLGVVKGVGNLAEGVVDLGTYAVGGVADILGADKFADKTKKFAQTSYMDKWTDPLDKAVSKNSFLGEKADAISEGLGYVGGMILTGGLGAGAGLGTAGVTALTTGTTFASSMGSGIGQAYTTMDQQVDDLKMQMYSVSDPQEKAKIQKQIDAIETDADGNAIKYGLISGIAEAGTELIFGGLGKTIKATGLSHGLSQADDMLAKSLTKKIENQIAKNFVEYGIKAGAEGTEEVLSGVIQAIGQKATYMSEEELGKLIEDQNLLESFITGAVVSGISQSPSFAKANGWTNSDTGVRDFITNYTQNEQSVIDKEVENRIAEQEKDGKKLSKKQINEITEQVQNDLEKGYISTDTIESVLGGDTYNTLKSTRDNKTKIENEIKELESKKNADITVKEMEHLKDLREQLRGIDTNTLETDLQGKMGQIIKSDGYLQRSYQEKAKKGQNFTYDASKVTNKFEKAALESASKVMNDTNRSHEFVEPVVKLAKDKGTYYEFTNNAELEKSNYDVKGKQVNGLVTVEKDGKKKILINVDSAKALNTIVGHETTHLLEGTAEYKELQDAIFNYAKTKGDFDSRQASLYSLYKDIKGADVNSELTADLVGDYLFTDNNFISELSTQKPTVFQKIKELIDDLVVRFKGTKEEKALREVQKKFKEAYRQQSGQQTVTQYSIQQAKDGSKYVNIDTDQHIFDGKTIAEQNKIAKEYILNTFRENGLIVDGKEVKVNNKTATKYTNPKENISDSKKRVKNRISTELDNLLNVSKLIKKETDKKNHAFAKDGWEYYQTTFKLNDSYFTGVANVGVNGDNRTLYDINQIKKTTHNDKAGNTAAISIGLPFYEDTISQKENNVKYSLTDNQGRTLTKEQQEFFKDVSPEVKDENGNLKRFYHGSNSEFTIFDINKSGESNKTAKVGFWFTESRNGAENFANSTWYGENKPATYEVYLNIKNPKIYESKDNSQQIEEINKQIKNIEKERETLKDKYEYGKASFKFVETLKEVYRKPAETILKEKGYNESQIKEYMNDLNEYNNLYKEIKKLETERMDLHYGDSYEQFRTDIYKLTGQTAEDANLGGIGMALNNQNEVMKQFRQNLIDEGYDGIVIKNTRFDTDTLGAGNNQYVAFYPNQIKNIDNTNPTTDPDIRYSLSEEQKTYFKDSKLRDENGDLEVVYHSTPNQFTVFDNSMSGENTGYDNTGFGTFVTTNRAFSERFKDIDGTGKQGYTMELFANVTKPITHPYKAGIKYGDEQASKIVEDYYKAIGETEALEEMQEMIEYEEADNLYDAYMNIVQMDSSGIYETANDERMRLEDAGYDAVEIIEGYESELVEGSTSDEVVSSYAIFNSNQLKNIDNANPTNNEDIRYSLGDDTLPRNPNLTYGEDVKLAIAPLQEEIQTLTETVQELKEQIAPIQSERLDTALNTKKGDEYAPLTEEDLPYLEQQYNEAPREDIAPPEIEENIPVSEDEITATKSLFETRNYEEVGDRKVNAYQYDNPEVKPYFQEAARNMMDDLANSLKGQRIYNDQLYYDSAGEQGYFGINRLTTNDIAELLDGVDGKYKLSYKDLEKGLKAIIEDHGAENNAASKRIEFYLDKRLREGFTTLDGVEIPANQEYIKLLQDKEMLDYYSNIPIGEAPIETSEEIAPVKDMNINDSGQGVLDLGTLNKLKAPEGKIKNKAVEPIDVNTAKQLTIDGKEEDLVTKTKKELRKKLLGTEAQKEFITNALDNAKNRSMALMNNTDTIRNTELVFGRDAGNIINEVIFQKEIDNEADSIAWQNKERQEIKELGIKARSKESAAVQKYGEKQYINEYNEVVAYGDAELSKEFSDVATQEKIKNAAKVIRSKYDAYIDNANNVLTKLGFEPIKKRKDYMRHFQELNDVFTRYGIPFNAQNMQEHTLPTDINGLTEFWSPQKNYFANMQPRKGMKTTYDAITGIDGYIGGIANLIYHTEDIQRGRAFEELIRETYGEDKGWDNLENLPEELQQARMEKIQDNHLSNYAAWVHEWTNNVAGKKNKIDRSIEAMFGRKAFAVLDEVRKQVGSNMIGFNLSSSLTNLIAPVQAASKTNKVAVLKGTADTIKNIFVKDNFMDNNKFLTARMGTDMLSQNAWQKMQNAGFVFMKGMDWFSSNQIVRSKYYELRAKGMSEAQAHSEAGKFAARILGDRTKGANAQLYNSKLVGLVTQFQLEVNNQLYSQFYDTYHESKEAAQGNALRTAAGMTFTLGQLFALTHLFGQTFEAIAGYNPTFDVVEMLKTAFGWGDDEEEEKPLSERLKSAADQLVDALPYVNILTGGGRIPIASGIPNLVGVATGGTDQYGNELTLEDEMKKLLYLIPPTGGNQFKKTTQGLSMFDEELPVSGSYTDSGNLRFPVEDTLGNRVQAAVFGQWASENARDYFDNERQPLKEKQIQEYADLDMPIKDYWKYREGLKDQSTIEEKFEYINGLDVTDEQKNIMINNATGREDPIDMSGYDNFNSYDEFDYATKNPDKYRVIEQIDTFDNFNSYKDDIASIKEQFSEDNGYSTKQRKAAVQQYINSLSLDIPQKIMLEKMAGGYSIKNYENYMFEYIQSLPMTAEEKQAIHNQLFN